MQLNNVRITTIKEVQWAATIEKLGGIFWGGKALYFHWARCGRACCSRGSFPGWGLHFVGGRWAVGCLAAWLFFAARPFAAGLLGCWDACWPTGLLGWLRPF
jgi:hypothetical protein